MLPRTAHGDIERHLTQPAWPCGHRTGPSPERAHGVGGTHKQPSATRGLWVQHQQQRQLLHFQRQKAGLGMPSAGTAVRRQPAGCAALIHSRLPSPARRRRRGRQRRPPGRPARRGGSPQTRAPPPRRCRQAGRRERRAGVGGRSMQTGREPPKLVRAAVEAMHSVDSASQAALLWAGCKAAVPCCSCRSWRSARQRISARLHPSGISRSLRLPSASVCPHRVLTERRGGWWRLQAGGRAATEVRRPGSSRGRLAGDSAARAAAAAGPGRAAKRICGATKRL